jgi:hypothetical protein
VPLPCGPAYGFRRPLALEVLAEYADAKFLGLLESALLPVRSVKQAWALPSCCSESRLEPTAETFALANTLSEFFVQSNRSFP